jgi:hypothetical protein
MIPFALSSIKQGSGQTSPSTLHWILQENLHQGGSMKYLVILFIMFPMLVFAGENRLTIQKDFNIHAWSFKEGTVTYYTDCRDIGGQCRQRCSDGELSIGHLSSANEGRDVYPYPMTE